MYASAWRCSTVNNQLQGNRFSQSHSAFNPIMGWTQYYIINTSILPAAIHVQPYRLDDALRKTRLGLIAIAPGGTSGVKAPGKFNSEGVEYFRCNELYKNNAITLNNPCPIQPYYWTQYYIIDTSVLPAAIHFQPYRLDGALRKARRGLIAIAPGETSGSKSAM